MIPVSVGTKKAPLNNRIQIREYVRYFEVENGIGKAVSIPKLATTTQRVNDFGLLYPPILVIIKPLTTTPIKGAVRQVIAK